MLAAQTFADLDVARPGDSTESLRRQVLANVDYVIAHRQSEPEAAEILASMAGTRATWATTRQVRSAFDGPGVRLARARGTRTPEREFVRHPDEFKRLRRRRGDRDRTGIAERRPWVRIWPWGPQRDRVAADGRGGCGEARRPRQLGVRAIASGAIPTVTLGRYRRYREEAIEAWVEEIEAGGVYGGFLKGRNGAGGTVTR